MAEISAKTYLNKSICLFLALFLLNLIAIPLEDSHNLIFAKIFAFDHEHNIPTFFAAINLAFAGFMALLYLLSATDNNEQNFWRLMSFLLLIMAYDEASGLHERIGQIANVYVVKIGPNINNYWAKPWIPIVIVTATYLIFASRKLPDYKYKLYATGALYLGGALGLELVGFEFDLLASPTGRILTTIEESIELISIVFLNYTIIRECSFKNIVCIMRPD